MTLQNGLVHREKAYLWTDEGFFCALTGKFLFLDSKACKSLTWPFAVSVSSVGGFPHEILAAIGEAAPPNMETLLWVVSDALRAFAASGHKAKAMIAAFERAPSLFIMSTDPMPDFQGGPILPAFAPTEILHHVSSGWHLPVYRDAVAAGLVPKSMTKIIDEQIKTPFQLAGPLSAVGERVWLGGGIVQIEVSRTGVKERVIRMVDTAEAA